MNLGDSLGAVGVGGGLEGDRWEQVRTNLETLGAGWVGATRNAWDPEGSQGCESLVENQGQRRPESGSQGADAVETHTHQKVLPPPNLEPRRVRTNPTSHLTVEPEPMGESIWAQSTRSGTQQSPISMGHR